MIPPTVLRVSEHDARGDEREPDRGRQAAGDERREIGPEVATAPTPSRASRHPATTPRRARPVTTRYNAPVTTTIASSRAVTRRTPARLPRERRADGAGAVVATDRGRREPGRDDEQVDARPTAAPSPDVWPRDYSQSVRSRIVWSVGPVPVLRIVVTDDHERARPRSERVDRRRARNRSARSEQRAKLTMSRSRPCGPGRRHPPRTAPPEPSRRSWRRSRVARRARGTRSRGRPRRR